MLFLILLSTSVAFADKIEMKKTITPKKINQDEIAKVIITLNNKHDKRIDGLLVDYPPKLASVEGKNLDKSGFLPKVLWNVSLSSGESKKYKYKLNFSYISRLPTGSKNVTALCAVFRYNKNSVETEKNWIYVTGIEKTENCNYNFECEPELGENSENCIQDCPIGGKDNYCDKRKDTICDPDCPEKDPDCFEAKTTTTKEKTTTTSSEEPICGNNICEKNENKENCPKDCEGEFPYYILWLLIAVVIVIISVMIIYESRKASGGNYE